MSAEVDAEVAGLRAVLRDVVALSAIPVAWVGREPVAVAAGLADTLSRLLRVDFVSVRLRDPRTAEAVEATRGDAWKTFAEWMETYLAKGGRLSKTEIVPGVDGAATYRGVVIPVGLEAQAGVVAAACDRPGFPTDTDQMLLRLAANQAAAAYQNACLVVERDRAEGELRSARDNLEVKVAEQTAEQSALRRVATLVARGATPEEVFTAVVDEVGQLPWVDLASICRYESDGTITFVAAWGRAHEVFPVGTRFTLTQDNLGTMVLRTGHSARVDHYADTASGLIGDAARQTRINSSLAAPIRVEGRLWGVIAASSTLEQPLPDDTEARLASFTELLGTAIANADGRAALARLADEQAALRRVATLVARRTEPVEVFEAVTEEVGRLLAIEFSNLARYEPDGTITSVATWARTGPSSFSSAGLRLGGKNLATLVFDTGRPARMDDYAEASGAVGDILRRSGLRSSVGAPITVEGHLWGLMSVGSSVQQSLLPDTEARLANFTDLVATAIADAQNRAELTESRARIVAAADDTRRRIERDLHDGVQQQLVTLGLKLRSIASAIPAELESLHADLGRVVSGLDDVLAELRELSRGIHPAVLSRGGLEPAIKTLARRSPTPVDVHVRLPARPPESIEAAAYYVVAEALTNVAKHAHASFVTIEVESLDGVIQVSVADDGAGGAVPTPGFGLIGLRDRVDALDAKMTITSPRGEGTTIVVRFPVTSE